MEIGLCVVRLGYIGKFGEGMGVMYCFFVFFGDLCFRDCL